MDRERLEKLLFYAKSNEKKLRKKAASELGDFNVPEAKNALIELSEDDDLSVRYFAKRSLRKLEIETNKNKAGKEKTEIPSSSEENLFIKTKLTQLYSPNKEERLNASRIIIEIGDPSIIDEIEQILEKEQDPRVVANLISIIGRLGNESHIPLLSKYLNEKYDSRVIANAIEALGKIEKSERVFKLVVPFIKSKNPRIVGNCAQILWNYSQEKTLILLKQMLESEDKNFIFSGLHACGELASLSTRKLAISILRHPKVAYKLRAAKTINKIDKKLFDNFSVLLLKKEELEKLKIPSGIYNELLSMLSEKGTHDLIQVALTLFYIVTPENRNVEINIEKMLTKDEIDDKLRATLVKVYAKVARNRAIPLLLQNINNPNERVVANVIESFQFVDDPRIIELLFEYLDHPNLRIRANAIKILSKGFKANLKAKIEELLKSPDEKENRVGLHILEEIAEEKDLPFITITTVSYTGELLIWRNRIINKLKNMEQEKVDYIGKDWSEEELREALEKGFDYLSDPDFLVRKNALELLKRNVSLDTIHLYVERLEKETNPYLIATLLKLVALCKRKEISGVIQTYLKHPDGRVRANALEALGQLEENPAILPMITPLLQDPELRVRKKAAVLMWQLSQNKDFQNLKNILNSVELALKTSADQVLKEESELSERKIKETVSREVESRIDFKSFIFYVSILFLSLIFIFIYSLVKIVEHFEHKQQTTIVKMQQAISKKEYELEKMLSGKEKIKPELLEKIKESFQKSQREIINILKQKKEKVKTQKPIVIPIKPIKKENNINHKQTQLDKKRKKYVAEIERLVSKKDYQTAMSLIEEGIKKYGKYPPILYQKGLIYFDQGKYQEALKLFKECVKKSPKKVEYLFYLAQTYALLNKYQKAIQVYKTLTLLAPADGNNYRELARLYFALGDYNNALKYIEKAIKVTPVLANDLMLLKGICFYYVKDYQKAKKIFWKLKKEKRGKELPYVYLGKIYLSEGFLDKAMKSFREALGINPSSVEALLGLANLYYVNGELDESRKLVEDILNKNLNNISALVLLAKINYKLRLYDEALKLLERALTLDKDEPSIYEVLIPILEKKKDYRSALDYLTYYLDLIPQSDTLKRNRLEQKMEELQNLVDKVKSVSSKKSFNSKKSNLKKKKLKLRKRR